MHRKLQPLKKIVPEPRRPAILLAEVREVRRHTA